MITPNNILPGVAPLSFNAGVNIPQSGVYQSLALGQQMMQWPLEMRYKENQLELQKQNMELNKQQIQQQLQQFEFEKQKYNDAAEADLETLRGNTFKVVDSLFGMEFYNEKDKARFEQLANESGLSQKEIAGMLQTGDNVQLRDTNKKMLALMSNPEVRKIMQKDAAVQGLLAEQAKNPKNFNPHAVSQAVRMAYDEDADFNPRDFAPANFVNKNSPIEDLKTKYANFSNVPPEMQPLVMEEFMRDYETYTGQSPYVLDEAGQVVAADNGSHTLNPEALSAYDYATGGAKLSDGELVSMMKPLADAYGDAAPELLEMYTSAYRSIEKTSGSKAAMTFLQGVITKGIGQFESNIDAQQKMELEEEKTARAIEVQEMKNAAKGRDGLYKEGLSTFFTPKSNAMLLATNLYDTWGIELGSAEDAAELQDILKENKGNIGKSVDAYLSNMYADDIIGAMSPEELAKAVNVSKYDDIVYLPETNEIEYTKGDNVVKRSADAIKSKPEFMGKVKNMARQDKKAKDDVIKAENKSFNSAVGTLGELIKSGEGGYDSYNRGEAGDSKGNPAGLKISSLSVGDILDKQNKGELFAVGAYQVIPSTLKKAIAALGISKDQKFTPALQDKIFSEYLTQSKRAKLGAYIRGESDDISAALLDLAKEFASVGVPYDMQGNKRAVKAGQSYYTGEAGNSASVSAEDAAIAIEKARQEYLKGLQEANTNSNMSERFKRVYFKNQNAPSKAPTTAPSQSGKQVEVIKRWGL